MPFHIILLVTNRLTRRNQSFEGSFRSLDWLKQHQCLGSTCCNFFHFFQNSKKQNIEMSLFCTFWEKFLQVRSATITAWGLTIGLIEKHKVDQRWNMSNIGLVKNWLNRWTQSDQACVFSNHSLQPLPLWLSPLQAALPNAPGPPPLLNSPSWLNPPRKPLHVLSSAPSVLNHLLQLLPKMSLLLQLCTCLSPAPGGPPLFPDECQERHHQDQPSHGKARH